MAGLVAIVGRDGGAPVSDRELAALADSYESLRGATARLTAEGPTGRVAVLAPEASLHAGIRRQGDAWQAYVGRPQEARQNGQSPPHSWDGQFALVAYDADANEVRIASDPLGMQALYVATKDDRMFVSTSLLALAKHLRLKPDRFAIETFLRVGIHFGALTNWEGARRLEPATLIRCGPHGQTEDKYWRPTIDPSIGRLSMADSAADCIDRSAIALRRYIAPEQRYSSDVTGGWDTRLLVLLLAHAGMSFVTNTVGTDDSPDVQLGARVAHAAGWQWSREAVPNDWPEISRRQEDFALAWGDGQLDVTLLGAVLWHHAARAEHADVQFNGGGGEHWRYYGWMQEFPRGGTGTRPHLTRLVNHVGYLKPVDVSPLRRDPTDGVRESLVRRLAAYAAPYTGLPKQYQLDVLYGYKSTGHYGAYMSASRGVLPVELPFYTRDVFACSFSVNPAYRNYHRFMRHVIERLNPAVAAVPTTNGGPALPFSLRRARLFGPYVQDQARRIAKQLTKNLPGPTRGAPPDAVHEPTEVARRRLLDEWDADRFADARAGVLYNRDRLSALARSPQATTSAWPILGRIITVEMALSATDASVE